ncbi:MAG: DNA cytosine methyltransferase [Parcubacteria group bacterium]|nr:DNA cytosine methyltransferase [Parcubacteria group bacterium]
MAKKNKVVSQSLFSDNRKIPNPIFKTIDLFAGIGGIRLGFESVGGENVFSSEWDKYAQVTYQANFGEIPYGDITKIKPEEIPEFDVLLAGFPCQPFSQAGLKRGFSDTRGTLFFDIAKIVDYHRPRVVFLENVKRLKSHDGGNTLKIIKETLESMGYEVHAKVLNAKDFGVPQNRERIYIVAFLGKTNFQFPEVGGVETDVGDILEENVDGKYTISDKLWAGHKRRKLEHKEKGNGFGYTLFNRESPYTNTISARYYKDGSEILIEQKNKNPRKLSPREAARLQGYPDDFYIPVSDAQAYKQFGNSVAVPVICELAKKIAKEMETIKPYKDKRKSINLEKIMSENITATKDILVSSRK